MNNEQITLLTESQMLNLFEERGVAISPWKKEIDSIAMYIRKEVKKLIMEEMHPIGENLQFSVPKEYLKHFNFLKNLQINVSASYCNENINSGGGTYHNGTVSSIKRKVKNAVIDIQCFYNVVGKVWLNSILNVLYHEFNHAYDAWLDANKTKSFNRFEKTAYKSQTGNSMMKEGKYPVIGTCIYRLFSETEYNALVASVFGDLQGINSDFINFQNDYKSTQAYNIYTYLKSNLQNEIDNLKDEDCNKIFLTCKKNNISLNMKENTTKSFKISFMTKANKLLNKLLKDIGRVASFYYDKKQEEEFKQKNIIIK